MAQTNVQAFSGDVEIAQNLAVDTNTLFVDSVSNRVGIGVALPDYDLDVQYNTASADRTMARLYSQAASTGTSYTSLRLEKGTGGYGGIIKGFIEQAVGGGLCLNTLNGNSDVQRLTIRHTGNVGIGTTNPKQMFEVDSTGYGLFSGRLGVGNMLTSAQNGGGQDLWTIGSSAKLLVRVANSQSPSASYANARAYAAIGIVPGFDGSDTTNIGLWGQAAGENPTFYIQNQVNNGANGAGAICLNPVAGSVGIGKSNPSQALDVVGIIKASGNMDAPLFYNSGGNLQVGSAFNYATEVRAGGSLRISVDNVERARFNTTGLSIGNQNAICPIYVTSGIAGVFYPQWMRWLTNYNINGTPDYHAHPVSTLPNNGQVGIYSQYSVGTQSYIFSQGGGLTGSDRRIKKDITDIDDESALETLRLLKPKKYSYKDTFNRGSNPVWGFIAQEVLEVLPYSASLQNDVIPNIYETANVSSSNVITFNNFNTSNLESNAHTITILDLGGARHEIELARIIDDKTIQVVDDLDEFTMTYDGTGNVVTEITTTNITEEEYEELSEDEKSYYSQTDSGYSKTVKTFPGTEIFVFGQKVDDFHYLKKDAIWTIATAALQEVDRQQQNDQERITTLETQVASLTTRLDALEST